MKSKCLTRRSMIAAGILIAASQNAAAQSAEEKSIEELVVTGSSRNQASEVAVKLEEFGNSIQVISAEDIADGGFANFAEIAQGMVRGANVGYSPDEGEFTIRLDGGGDRDTLVTLDNVPLYDRGPGVEAIWGATQIDPRMIERVEVFRGGQSLYFGSNGGLGVVNVVTKAPDGTTHGEAGFRYGSFNTRELWGNYTFPLSEDGQHAVMVYGGRNASDGHRIFDRSSMSEGMAAAGGIRDYSNSRDNIGIKYRWMIDSDSELLMNLQHTQVDFQDTFPNNTLFGNVHSSMPLFNLSYQTAWSDRVSTQLTASYRAPKLVHNKVAPELCEIETGCPAANGSGALTPYGEWTGNVVPLSDRGFGDHSIEGGFEETIVTAVNTFYLNSSLEAVVGFQSMSYADNSDSEVLIDDSTFTTNGLFVDMQWNPSFSPSTAISIAARTDWADAFGSEDISKFGFRQPLGAGFYLRANGGKSYSLPLTNELYATTENVVGNPDLRPERTETYNYGMGFDGELAGNTVRAEIGGFRSDITDRIRTTTGLFPNTRFNDPAVTEVRGTTLDLDMALGSNWSTTLSYTRQEATPEDSDVQINSTPEWFASATLRWKSDTGRYHFALLPRWQGPETVQSPHPDLEALDYGSWFLLNATAGYRGGVDKQHRVQLRVVNLLDEVYGERGSFGNQQYSGAFVRGEITRADAEFYYPYIFQGKPRSAYLEYSYSFQ